MTVVSVVTPVGLAGALHAPGTRLTVPDDLVVRVWANMGWSVFEEAACTPTIADRWPVLGILDEPTFLEDVRFGCDERAYHASRNAQRGTCAWVTGHLRAATSPEVAAWVAVYPTFGLLWDLAEIPSCGAPFGVQDRPLATVRQILFLPRPNVRAYVDGVLV